MEYRPAKIEKKWQKKWEEKKIFEVKEKSKKKKYYVLEQFPYPSGTGLHMGHSFIYTIADIFARFKRLQGFNVLYPAGYDSLGLPAENAAIKTNIHPQKYTDAAVINFQKQQKALGLSYDWSRMFWTHDPNFYRWDQWIFLKMLEKGLAYQKESAVNWCPSCQTVLANEQAQGGICERCKSKLKIKNLKQWYLKITNYAEELADFSKLSQWSDVIVKLQKNWIGKSYGAEIDFTINGKKWPVFTTRSDTIYGVTFMVVSAHHPELFDLVTSKQKKKVEDFVNNLSSVSQEDIEKLEKEGVFTGSYAINPINGKKIPVYVGNFVIADYGGGLVMAVPAHDQRDFEFAKKYGISIKQVIEGKSIDGRAYTGKGKLINSGEFNGLENEDAKQKILEFLQNKKLGRKIIKYRLRDWLISRQRYWGTPIPVVYCDKCGVLPVDERDLPVKLPKKVIFGKGNPLETAESWMKTRCPKCGGPVKRETDTMDTFVNSSWYDLRFTDPHNKNKIFDSGKTNYWVPIDLYIGGKEHACMHDLYIRFYHKFLRDLGFVNSDEPAIRLFAQGMVLGEDGNKMSKSIGNIVDPLEIISTMGADALRLFLISVASPESDFQWDSKGVNSTYRFVKKLFSFVNNVNIGKSNEKLQSKLNKTIFELTENIENLKYNLAVIKIRSLLDFLFEQKEISKSDLESFLILIHPFCPHVTEELWEKIGNNNFISLSSWPSIDKEKINDKFEKEDEMISKLKSDIMNIKKVLSKENASVYVYVLPSEIEIYLSLSGVKVFAVNDKDKYDPENKSKKAKPGRPAIYVE